MKAEFELREIFFAGRTKNTKIFLLLLLLLAFFCGCSPREKQMENPKKILSLSAAASRVLAILDSPPAAIDEYGSDFVKEYLKSQAAIDEYGTAAGGKKPVFLVIGRGEAVSLEKLVELGVDGVILWNYQQNSARQFRKMGLNIMEIPPIRLKEYPVLVRKIGNWIGKEDQAEKYSSDFQKKLSVLQEPARKIPVYFELYGPGRSAGVESYIGDLLAYSGGRLMNRKTGLVNVEKLQEFQPEIIFYIEGFSAEHEIRKRVGFSNFPAVKNNRIYAVPRRLITEGVAPFEAIEFFKKYMR